jgi:hypothetical protein
MLSLIFVLYFSAGVASPVTPTDPSVQKVRPYLDQVLPLLFFDAHGPPEVTAADKEGLTSYALNLSITMPHHVQFTALVTVSQQGKAHLEALAAPPPSEVPGGYVWHDPASVTEEDLKLLKSLLTGKPEFGGVISKILAYRTQVVSGANHHYIFSDPDGGLYAALVYINIRLEKKLSNFAKAE